MANNSNAPQEKKQIYFARTYRHLEFSPLECVLFLLLVVLPSMVLIFLFYDDLAWAMSYAAAWVLNAVNGIVPTLAVSEFVPRLGPVCSLVLPTVQPTYGVILGNLAVTLLLIWFLCTGSRKGRPVSMYMCIVALVHTMSCVFFLLGKDMFPYSLADFSDLYVKQQAGLWIMFLLLMGLVMGILGRGSLLLRLVSMVVIIGYSFLFGLVRYVLFLYVLSQFSVLFMPVMYFALGPAFDFMYFVAIYAISTNGLIRSYESKRKGDWKWA